MGSKPQAVNPAPRARRVQYGGRTRTVRVPDDLWDAALAKAQDRGESLSEIIRQALERYLDE